MVETFRVEAPGARIGVAAHDAAVGRGADHRQFAGVLGLAQAGGGGGDGGLLGLSAAWAPAISSLAASSCWPAAKLEACSFCRRLYSRLAVAA
jgi:hypothetical protein